MFEVLILSIQKPLLIGVYEDKKLIKTISSNKKTSDILASLINDIFNEFKDIKAFYYAKGPGSYLGVKLVYIFLSSISIIKKIPFYGAIGFCFNGNSPIKAIGNKYFFSNKDKPALLEQNKVKDFVLPKILQNDIFSKNAPPEYKLAYLN